MKITYSQYNAVAAWKWDLKPTAARPPSPQKPNRTRTDAHGNHIGDDVSSSSEEDGGEDDEEEEEEDDENCGICQLEFESACPQCKVPGDDCPLMWGQCTHVFHMHCLLKWLNTESSKEQCPLDRRPWVTAEREMGSHGVAQPRMSDGTGGATGTGSNAGAGAGGGDDSLMTIGEESGEGMEVDR